MADITTIDHPEIGKVRGTKAKEGVEQSRGIQYATVKDRFAPAVLKIYDGQGIEATSIGPQTAPLLQGAEHEQDLIQHRLPNTPVAFSDTEGLNLNITYPTPRNREDYLYQASHPLPVLVFIHGGGFMVGSASYPQYDMARFVALSAAKGLPIIAVTLNYRLGPPGLLTSKEMREHGYLPNNALRDQRVAIEWVRKYIAGFGGDPDNITLAGESAGSISCCHHLQAKEKLFKRVIAMSGTGLLIPPFPVEAAELNYVAAIKALGLEEKSVEERMERLCTMDAGELRAKLASMPMLPVVDDELPVAPYKFADFASGKAREGIAGSTWCEEMMIGDCAFDGSIQSLRIGHRKKGCAKQFCDEMKRASDSPQHAEKLLEGYGITPDLDDETAYERILETLNDIGFYTPTLAYAKALSGGMKTYMYRSNEPNPWGGPWKGKANHILDVALLFQNFNEYLDEAQRKSADAFAEGVIRFVSGQAPWEPWTADAKKAMVIGPQGRTEIEQDVPGDGTGRSAVMLELARTVEGGMDRLSEVLHGFIRGPPAT
ncbi:hypothetical protein LTR53_006733 [Teratosphaeriaceae sp. CCFEE 6253]|nr:hypothetical protein LTR53_006733 [Teratosphaeriaceae sp. CCFEE 6253]